MYDRFMRIKSAFALLLVVPMLWTNMAHAATSCSNLVALTIQDAKIASATQVPAGAFAPPGANGAPSSNLPAFCRVVAIAKPSTDSLINLEVWIPAASSWNGKFQGVGNNAFLGSISYAAMADALRSGYATASSDAGHVGGELDFAQGHPEKAVDWSYRSAHITAEVERARRLVQLHAKPQPEDAQGEDMLGLRPENPCHWRHAQQPKQDGIWRPG